MTPTITRWIRLVAGLLGALAAGSAWAAGQLAADSTSGSPGAAAAAALAGLGAAGCVVTAVAPAHWHRPLWALRGHLQRRLSSPPGAISPTAAAAVIVSGGIGFAVIVARWLALPEDPWDDDQGAFLITAGEIRDAGGIRWLWSALWSGAFDETNRHPLYLALLSIQPTVRSGQFLSVAIGVLTWVLLTGFAVRRCGLSSAAVFCVLLATNAAFCQFSTRIVCDVLLVLWCGLAWLIHLPPTPDAAVSRISPLRCGIGGGLMGLAWLTKGTGLVLLAGYLLWIALGLLWAPRTAVQSLAASPQEPRADRRLPRAILSVVCAVAAFLAVGAPLIARNAQRFGNPFHNLNSLLLFADRYEDLPGMVDRGLSTGSAAREFLASHSVGDMLQREANGLIWEAFIIVRSLGPAPLDDARVLLGVPLALLAIARMGIRRSAADGLLLIWGGLCWAVFAWYVPIAAGERFVLPLLAPLLILASEALSRGAVGETRGLVPWIPALAVAWCAVWGAASWVLLEAT